MTIEQAQRLVWLIDEQRRCLKRANSLQRRVLKLLADATDDSTLVTTTLTYLESVLEAYLRDASVASLTLAQCERGEPINDEDDDAYDRGTD